MVNLDSLGLGRSKLWLSRSDKRLTSLLNGLANAMRLPLGAGKVENVGSSDGEQFAERKIPRIAVHSLTQETWPILHSSRDTLQTIHLDNYYDIYNLLAGYLALLDDTLGKESN